MPEREFCPCGSGVTLADCCGRFLDDRALPDTAERLMRSRYTAYVLGAEAYLRRTWHESTRPAGRLLDETPVTWLGLDVRRADAGADRSEATVEFVARYRIDGRAARLHEISRFVRAAGRWYYVDGKFVCARGFDPGESANR
jgi:SEC-C motif domain protein